MRKIALSLAAFAAMLSFALSGSLAHAQNDNSWVASYGSNGNPCTRTQPCQTFSKAVSVTNPSGVINCIDQGEFGGSGAITISTALTIDCEGVQGRVLVTQLASAFTVSAGANDDVTLRGLEIYSDGGGLAGVELASAKALHIEKCIIHHFNGGWGILAWPGGSAGTTELFVSDTVLENNGGGGSGGGIDARPVGTGNILKVVLNRVEAQGNFFGIRADGSSSNGGVVQMTIRDSVSSGNAANGIVGTSSFGSSAVVMMIDRSASSHNAAGYGVIADGPVTTIRLGNSSIAGNITGVGATNGGSLQSFKTNQIKGNSTDGTPLPAVGLD
ncbi:MAG: hypothetical protein JO273_05655 [Methylobacteriaceae bacterium]|nr:hypothetical protein [Methylobacteriaceae bacterium]